MAALKTNSEQKECPGRARSRFVATSLAEGRAHLALQPVVQARAPERSAFHEGLIRLRDRQGRLVPAGLFVGATEGSALGLALDRQALVLGLDTLAIEPGLRLALNVSPHTMSDSAWHDILHQRLDTDPTLAERLIVEITERSVIECPAQMASFVSDMQRTGLSVALDDFGAGYTSFRHFSEIRFDILKIDGRFSHGIDSNPDNRALVRAMRDIAQHFEMLTVAECVETASEADCLCDMGIDTLQGYHFGRPALRDGSVMPIQRRRA